MPLITHISAAFLQNFYARTFWTFTTAAAAMSLSIDTVFQAVDLIKKAVELYQRIDGLPKQMTTLGRRLEQLSIFLGHLAAFAKAKSQTAYDKLLSGQKEQLQDILVSIKGDIDAAYDLFDRYEKGILSRRHDMQFRVKWAAQIWFSLAENTPEKVGALIKSIDDDCMFLNHYFALMNAQGIEHMINNNNTNTSTSASTNTNSLAAPGGLLPKPKQRSRSASPMPRTDYTIIFIDPYNQARSVVAAAWVYTFMAWTLKSKANWRIKHCHAAGFFVKNRSDCTDLIEKLNYSQKSFKKPFKDGGVSPDKVPREALFDGKHYKYPDKKVVEDKVGSWRSRGVTKSIFKDYDYIVVMTNREHDNMIQLKKALIKQQGPSAAPRGKGKLLMLGAYQSPPGEILDAPKNKDGSNNRANWDKKVGQLRTAIEAFLSEEFRWEQPKGKGTPMS